ncbi:GNAT family N-acetyltransferase [uncultured Bacteroides sp.]|uniref:GNAT family N-acetyltransferase n=1 Tax=uncultured Bacteroides sp. TaxID=162156 RepID=UPI0025EE3E30|nr:GNAT family N-acetyltransferase [uncultured Bacteroides sp.]
MTENYELIDNEEKHQYEFHVEGYVPRIEYIKSLNGEIYLTHTEVPAALGGHGIGSQLAEKVLTDIERQGFRLVPLCPFVAGYIHKHPEWKRIVLRGVHIQ